MSWFPTGDQLHHAHSKSITEFKATAAPLSFESTCANRIAGTKIISTLAGVTDDYMEVDFMLHNGLGGNIFGSQCSTGAILILPYPVLAAHGQVQPLVSGSDHPREEGLGHLTRQATQTSHAG